MVGATHREREFVVDELSRLEVEKVSALHCSGEVMRKILSEKRMLLDAHVGSRIMITSNGVKLNYVA